MLYVWQLKFLVTLIEHLDCLTLTEVEMKGYVSHLSWLHEVVPGVWVLVGRSLECTSVSQMFVSHLYVFSGGWL